MIIALVSAAVIAARHVLTLVGQMNRATMQRHSTSISSQIWSAPLAQLCSCAFSTSSLGVNVAGPKR